MDNVANHFDEDVVSEDVEHIFQLGLEAWENFGADLNFSRAKDLFTEAKSKGHPLADMYFDIVCAFEEVAVEGQ